MTALKVLTALFNEEAPEDETSEAIAALVIDRLRENGFVLAPIELQAATKRVLRAALYDKTRGVEAGDRPRHPAELWAAIIKTITGE